MGGGILYRCQPKISIQVYWFKLRSVSLTMSQYSVLQMHSSPGRYKMCLNAEANGNGKGKGSGHVSVFAYLMRVDE